MAGGGFGEAALMSAVIGGGMSAAKGEDPLKGALLGGAGNLSGIGNLLSPAATTAATTAVGGALAPAVVGAELGLVTPAIENAFLGSALPNAATNAATAAATNAATNQSVLNAIGAGGGAPAAAVADSSLVANAVNAGAPAAAENLIPEAFKLQNEQLRTSALSYPPPVYPPVPSQGGLGSLMNKLGNLSTQEKLLYGGTAALAAPAVMSMFKGKEELGGKEEYDGPLKRFRYDPSRYTPSNVTPPVPYQARYAAGGIANLGGYSDYARGGRMLKGPGDGMSDDIPATIAGKQPARLANEEFVIPADVVSHLGNGSSEAGAKQLYKMMDRIRKARTGTKKQGKQINPEKYLA